MHLYHNLSLLISQEILWYNGCCNIVSLVCSGRAVVRAKRGTSWILVSMENLASEWNQQGVTGTGVQGKIDCCFGKWIWGQFRNLNVRILCLWISILNFDVFSTVHHSIGLFLQPTLMHNSITHVCHITMLDMFRALTCPSSGGTTAQTQHLVSSLF